MCLNPVLCCFRTDACRRVDNQGCQGSTLQQPRKQAGRQAGACVSHRVVCQVGVAEVAGRGISAGGGGRESVSLGHSTAAAVTPWTRRPFVLVEHMRGKWKTHQ